MNIAPCRPKWKGTLTDRERFVRQMHYQPVDRTFNMEFGYWDENFKLWPIFSENGILRAETMRFADELRSPTDIGVPKKKKPPKASVQKFARLIKKHSSDELSSARMHDMGK